MRIRREENEKRLGLATSSITGSSNMAQRPGQQKPLGNGGQNRPGEEIGYVEIASIGWGRIKKSVLEAVPW